MDLDDASNGIFLRNRKSGRVSTISRHHGFHSDYNNFVRGKLNQMDISKSVDELQKEVYNLQQNLKKIQQSGLPIYAIDNTPSKTYKNMFEKVTGQKYKNNIIDLLERWFNK